MNLQIIKFAPLIHRQILAEFLSSQLWKFHVNSSLTIEKVYAQIDEGNFTGEENETFLIFNAENDLIGIIRLFDMDDIADGDGSPLFDMRISNKFQGSGVGTQSVQWLTKYLFESHSKLNRIEATTRADNYSMRKVFKKCYFLKEGHYRASWRNENGELLDTIRYAILRNDWNNKNLTPLEWEDF
jgi:RimJ/RimL family protein N-acetyltransferase